METESQEQAKQARRLVYILKEVIAGKTLTTHQLQKLFSEEYNFNVTLRSVQRDLRVLQECVPTLEQIRDGNGVHWQLARTHFNGRSLIRVESNELLSFYILKSHLKTFKGTVIEDDTNKLAKKLEQLAPGDVFLDESLFWDQNVGQFDYSKHNDMLKEVIECIVKKKWVKITYHSTKQTTDKTYEVLFHGLFTYSGSIYIVTYFPSHRSFEAIALHGIMDIKRAVGQFPPNPKFDFKHFTDVRYGVYTGDRYRVILMVKKEFTGYFVGRYWHSTQRERYDEEGNLIIEMYVPIGMDLVAWILGWNEIIKVLQPKELVEKVVTKLDAARQNYRKKRVTSKRNFQPIKY
ncbi:MAG: WYL domain-containing protein [FCB group bacterium]